MLQAKYKAHKFINLLFYLVVFIIGFFMGFSSKNFNFNEIISRLLLIDNTYALERNTYHYNGTYTAPTVGSNGSYKNEEYIYNLFNYFSTDLDLNISFNRYHYVITTYSQNASSLLVTWYFSTEPISLTQNGWTGVNVVKIVYNYYAQLPYIWTIDTYSSITSTGGSFGSNAHSNQQGIGTNDLDFSNYLNQLVFDPNLFTDYSDFKQVCVDPHKQFIISTSSYYNNYNYFSDYIWFPYLIGGIYEGDFTLEDNLVTYWNKTGWFLNSKNNIDTYFFPNVGFYPWVYGDTSLLDETFVLNQQTTIYPYSLRYSYYGWFALPITMQFNYQGYTSVTSFKFDEELIQTLSVVDNGALPFTINNYDLTDSQNDNLELCFYVNERYDISYLDKNGAFITGNISTPTGNIDIYSNEKDIGFESNDYQALFDYLGEFDNDFGLSTIVLAPLNAIYSITQGICEPQSINIMGKSINLPCGDVLFWDREDVQPFKVFWNMFWGGIICYNIGIYIFKLVHDYKHPTNDRVEVIDL